MSLQDFSTLIAGLFPEGTERSSKRPAHLAVSGRLGLLCT
jgi:hypothetical protein